MCARMREARSRASHLKNHGYWGMVMPLDEMYSMLSEGSRIRIAEEGEMYPNFETWFVSNDVEREPLSSYGGAGPLFADRLARKLGIEYALVPAVPGVLSAFGLVTADRRFDFSTSRPLLLSSDRVDEINEIYDDLEARAHAEAPNANIKRAVDLRYQGQTFELTVDVPSGEITAASIEEIRERFERQYESVYGQINPDETVEALTWRLDAVNATPPVEPQMDTKEHSIEDAIKSTRPAYTEDGFVEHVVYDRYKLPVNESIEGPAIVEESESTTVIGLESRFRIDQVGNLLIHVG